MLKMSIRHKLFFAFALVAAISSAALLLLARSYVASVRAQLDRQFLDDARAAFERQTAAGERLEQQAESIVTEGALDPQVLSSFMSDESAWHVLFERVPLLRQLALYDDRQRIWELAWGRPGQPLAVDPLRDKDFAEVIDERGMLGGGADFVGHTTVTKNGRLFAIAAGSSDGKRGMDVIAELDLPMLFRSALFDGDARALFVDCKSGRPLFAPDEVDYVRKSLPGLDRLLAQRPPNGETADVDDGHGRRYRLYAAISAEESRLAIQAGATDVALTPLDGLYAPLARIRMRVLLSVATTILLALLAALILSGRFVGDIERIRGAVAAFAKGDWRRLEKSSRDELGGELVDSINNMAIEVAERMRRDEAESWRSLVRVVSHEINNTLAPIRSVAASLRCGLPRRLRVEDAGADVEMALKLIVERVDALATFIDGYAEVAKLPPPHRQLTDIAKLVNGVSAAFAQQAAVRQVGIDTDDVAGGAVEIDAQQVERVLVNVIKNAIEASPRDGKVVVRAARVAGGLEIGVADDGPGIGPEARRNLFVPYFSTKPGGSGIGLALARQIVVAHGGTITAERSSSGGTLMRIVIPDVVHAHPYREAG
jgi:signal transduction histidine kinase